MYKVILIILGTLILTTCRKEEKESFSFLRCEIDGKVWTSEGNLEAARGGDIGTNTYNLVSASGKTSKQSFVFHISNNTSIPYTYMDDSVNVNQDYITSGWLMNYWDLSKLVNQQHFNNWSNLNQQSLGNGYPEVTLLPTIEVVKNNSDNLLFNFSGSLLNVNCDSTQTYCSFVNITNGRAWIRWDEFY